MVRIMKFMKSRMALLILCCSFSQQLLQLYWSLTSVRKLRAHVCSGVFFVLFVFLPPLTSSFPVFSSTSSFFSVFLLFPSPFLSSLSFFPPPDFFFFSFLLSLHPDSYLFRGRHRHHLHVVAAGLRRPRLLLGVRRHLSALRVLRPRC